MVGGLPLKKMTTSGPELENLLFKECLTTLKDPRRTNKGNIKYSLEEIIFLTLSAVVSGFQTYELIEGFGEERLDWLRQFYPYKHGRPSHDTLGEFYSRLKPKEFAKCLIFFTESLANHDTRVIALDGKTVKGFLTKEGYPLHILTAFCTKNRMSLGEETVAGKENEIVAIPRLLDLICIKNSIITIDAMGCQTEIAKKIREQEADYILQVKNNQKTLLENIEDSFAVKKVVEIDTTEDCGHGRVEVRKCSVISDLEFIDQAHKWTDLKTIVKIESIIYFKKTEKETTNARYYISSLPADAGLLNESIRSHWLIENVLHWNLDVIFREDNQAKRNQTAIENANLIAKLANTMLDQEKTFPKSKNRKRLKAFADNTYRELILNI
jgi:predicted transposase YbfD/YdcC